MIVLVAACGGAPPAERGVPDGPPKQTPGLGQCCSADGTDCTEVTRFQSRGAFADKCAKEGKKETIWCPEDCTFDANKQPPCAC